VANSTADRLANRNGVTGPSIATKLRRRRTLSPSLPTIRNDSPLRSIGKVKIAMSRRTDHNEQFEQPESWLRLGIEFSEMNTHRRLASVTRNRWLDWAVGCGRLLVPRLGENCDDHNARLNAAINQLSQAIHRRLQPDAIANTTRLPGITRNRMMQSPDDTKAQAMLKNSDDENRAKPGQAIGPTYASPRAFMAKIPNFRKRYFNFGFRITKRPSTVFQESFVFLPVKTIVQSRPPLRSHLLGKFQ
jgi:hypothetical protein